MRVALLGVVVACVACAACERPPVGPPVDPPGDGRVGPIALERFTQDRPAIAGKWYDYNVDGHSLQPKAQAWIVKDGSRVGAFRIVSIYESEAAESGLFTLSIATHDGDTWSAETEWVASRNIKETGPMCLDLFSEVESDCTDVAWQLRFALFQYFSPLAGIAVGDPGVFVRSVAGTDAYGAVRIARIDDVTSLDALPDPSSLTLLDDGPAPEWDLTDWDFAKLAPDLPEVGMALGARFVDSPDDVYWLMTSRFDLVRFSVGTAVVEEAGALRISYSVVAADREDWSAPDSMPTAVVVDVPVPATGAAVWLAFDKPSLLAPAEDIEGASWPFAPPKSTRYDIAIERPGDRVARVLVSPAAAILNATQLGLSEDTPPVSTP